MSRFTRGSISALALAVGIARVVAAQPPKIRSNATDADGVSLATYWTTPALTASELARLNGILVRANALAHENRFDEAGRLYWSVVAEQRAADDYPAEALRQLAKMYYSADQEFAAADVHRELAESAARFGDHATLLRALFDAALLYRNVGRTDRVAECVRQLRPLLMSADIPESLRRDISNRIIAR